MRQRFFRLLYAGEDGVVEGGGGGRDGEGGGYSVFACHNLFTIDQAFLTRRSIVLTPSCGRRGRRGQGEENSVGSRAAFSPNVLLHTHVRTDSVSFIVVLGKNMVFASARGWKRDGVEAHTMQGQHTWCWGTFDMSLENARYVKRVVLASR